MQYVSVPQVRRHRTVRHLTRSVQVHTVTLASDHKAYCEGFQLHYMKVYNKSFPKTFDEKIDTYDVGIYSNSTLQPWSVQGSNRTVQYREVQ